MVKPYTDEYLNENEWIRKFNHLVDSDELVWHRDENDREVYVIDGEGWQFQYENEMPKPLNKYDRFNIKKMTFHRLLKGKTKLKLRIMEI